MFVPAARARRPPWRAIRRRVQVGLRALYAVPFRLYRRARLKQARDAGLRLGQGVACYGRVNWGSEPWLIEVGDNTVIASRVVFITHDGGIRVWRTLTEPTHLNRFGPIRIGANCFIGYGVIILPNVLIGDNSVIGAGSVVATDIPGGSVAAGCPARVISTIDEYGKKAERETLLDLGHSPGELWEAVWRRFDEMRAMGRP